MVRIEKQMIFENYNKLFDFICEMDGEVQSGKTFESYVDFEGSSWSFVIYPPERVASFHQLASTIEDPNFQEAYEQRLGLLEICKGGFKYPQYFAITPNVDIGGLKKKWCQEYCAFHGLAIRATFEEETHTSEIVEHSSTNRKEFDHVNRI